MVMFMGMTEDELRQEFKQMREIMKRNAAAIEGYQVASELKQHIIEVRNRAIEDLENALATKTIVCEQHEKMIASQEHKINELIKELNAAKQTQVKICEDSANVIIAYLRKGGFIK